MNGSFAKHLLFGKTGEKVISKLFTFVFLSGIYYIFTFSENSSFAYLKKFNILIMGAKSQNA